MIVVVLFKIFDHWLHKGLLSHHNWFITKIPSCQSFFNSCQKILQVKYSLGQEVFTNVSSSINKRLLRTNNLIIESSHPLIRLSLNKRINKHLIPSITSRCIHLKMDLLYVLALWALAPKSSLHESKTRETPVSPIQDVIRMHVLDHTGRRDVRRPKVNIWRVDGTSCWIFHIWAHVYLEI